MYADEVEKKRKVAQSTRPVQRREHQPSSAASRKTSIFSRLGGGERRSDGRRGHVNNTSEDRRWEDAPPKRVRRDPQYDDVYNHGSGFRSANANDVRSRLWARGNRQWDRLATRVALF